MTPHVCHYVEPDGTTAGACHLIEPHGGRCARGCVVDLGDGRTAHATAAECVHQAAWELALLCTEPNCEVHV